jgi:hypothetical protein
MATWPTITDDSGNNTSGTIINNANVWTPIQTYIGGTWTVPAFNAGHYTASAGSWTVDAGDRVIFQYTVVGKTCILNFQISATDVSSTPASLRVTVPGGFTINGTFRSVILVSDAGGAAAFGYAVADSATSSTLIYFTKADGTNWTATSGDNTTLIGTAIFQIA